MNNEAANEKRPISKNKNIHILKIFTTHELDDSYSNNIFVF